MKNIMLLSMMSAMIFLLSCSKGNKSEVISVPDYKKWKKPVNEIMDYPVPGHGAGFRIIYANDVSYSAKISTGANGLKKTVFPDGSYIIKESYKNRQDIGKKEPVVYGMIKNSSSPEAVSGWIYYVKKPKEPLKIITTKMCIGCHESANEKHPYFDGNRDDSFRDYLFVPIAKEK